jgi:hypothetical protein
MANAEAVLESAPVSSLSFTPESPEERLVLPRMELSMLTTLALLPLFLARVASDLGLPCLIVSVTEFATVTLATEVRRTPFKNPVRKEVFDVKPTTAQFVPKLAVPLLPSALLLIARDSCRIGANVARLRLVEPPSESEVAPSALAILPSTKDANASTQTDRPLLSPAKCLSSCVLLIARENGVRLKLALATEFAEAMQERRRLLTRSRLLPPMEEEGALRLTER